MPYTLYKRTADTVVFPAAGDSIFILSVTAVETAPGTYDLSVEGISNGSATCGVNLLLMAGPLNVSPVINAAGFFTAAFAGLALAAGSFLAVEGINTAAGANGKDGHLLTFPGQPKLGLANGPVANVDPLRFDFKAGNPDRIVNTRFFNQLVLEPLLKGHFKGVKTVVYGKAQKSLKVKELDKLLPEIKKVIKPIWDEFAKGKIRYPEFLFRSRILAKEVNAKLTRKATEEEAVLWASKFQADKKAVKALKAAKPMVSQRYRNNPSIYALSGSTSLIDFRDIEIAGTPLQDALDQLEDFLDYLYASDDFQGRVGLLFSDRLRFQPAGLVVGEQVYTMSLAPGEEVELRQVVETKRKSTIEDIVDREQELSFNLTASWTNEITEGLAEQSSIQSAVNVGANANVKLPIEELPIGFGINVSNSVTTADSITREQSTTTAFERTSNAASKMRSQHKIRMEITNEQSNSLTTTRKIRNANSQRSQTNIFSKVYRKERVTLERYGLQLCFRLVVNDPSFRARSNFLANLDKIDPNNPAHYAKSPTGVSTSGTFDFEYGQGQFMDEYSTSFESREIDMRGDLKKPDGTAAPGNFILSSSRLGLVEFQIDEYVNTIVSSTTTSSTSTSMNDFKSHHGVLEWEPAPSTGGTSAKGTVVVGLSHRWFSYIVGVNGIMLKKATIKVSADWVPAQADLDAIRAANEDLRRQLADALNEEKILQLRNNSINDYPGQVLAEAISRGIEQTQEMVHLRHIFDFQNAIVESAPYWASTSGVAAYRDIERRLSALPVPLAINSVLTDELTSPQAIVYIPVIEGHEADALDLLPGVDWQEKARIMSDIDQYRANSFAPVPTYLPTYDEILGPAPLVSTPADVAAWATEWEKPQKQFQVVSHWSLLTPTDGLHMEARLSESQSTDEHQTRMLENQTGD